MVLKLKISTEMKFLISTIFSENFDKKEFKNINTEKLVNLASSHLILPLLYVRINNTLIKSLFDLDFINYIKKIHSINNNRNSEAINEIHFLSKILKKNGIKHVFIKGAAIIVSKIPKQYGIRMLGDIDILVKDRDFNKTIKILKKNKYYNKKFYYNFFNSHHYPRLVAKKKIFAVEIHNKISSKNKIIRTEKILDQSIKINSVSVPKFIHQKIIAIWNFQDGDGGLSSCNYSLRNYYDVFAIFQNQKFNDKILNHHLFRKYFTIASHFGLIKKTKFRFSKVTSLRFILKNKFKFYRNLDNFFVLALNKIIFRLNQLFKLLTDKKYRDYINDNYKSL